MYDVIGDIHGHYNDLINLLIKMGYKKENNSYKHSTRKVLFLGDYIDRGINQEKVINLVRTMITKGDAMGIMGNHEYNAICFATANPDSPTEYLRPHNKGNISQHQSFLNDFPFGSDKHTDAIKWFKTLPLFIDLGDVRFVHATWDKESIEFLKENLSNNKLDDKFIIKSSIKGTDEFIHLEKTLKGIELTLPDDLTWSDMHGKKRNTMRFNWFQSNSLTKYRECALSFPDVSLLPDRVIKNKPKTYIDTIPVFFGHYWFSGKPRIQHSYAACLDYSVAKNGTLVAYRWNFESKLNNNNFFYN